MQKKINTHLLGKLRIYLPNGEKVHSKTLLRKLFPKQVYRKIIQEAKKDGIMNASAFITHFGYGKGGTIQNDGTAEIGNPFLTMCVELIDTKEKLQEFFIKHQDILAGKVVIYKEVEFWDAP